MCGRTRGRSLKFLWRLLGVYLQWIRKRGDCAGTLVSLAVQKLKCWTGVKSEMLGPLGQGTTHVHSKLWYTILGPGGWGYSATHLGLEPSTIWVTTNGLKRWVVSFWSPELRSFWLAQQIESSGWAQTQKSANCAQAQKYELIMDTVETIVLAAHPGPSQSSWSMMLTITITSLEKRIGSLVNGRLNLPARSEWNR